MNNVIHTYTRDQAIENGVLLRIEQYLTEQELDPAEELREVLKNDELFKFPLGAVVITRTAADVLHPVDVLNCVMRHRLGDWRCMDQEDVESNGRALRQGERQLSAYDVSHRHDRYLELRVWIITEWNREATTVLLPDDY